MLKKLDKQYLELLLRSQENGLSEWEIRNHLDNIIFGYTCYYKEQLGGVAYITEFYDRYFFEAYKDPQLRVPIRYSLSLGERMLQDFYEMTGIDTIYSIHTEDNKLSTLGLLKLDFKIVKQDNNRLLFVRRF